MQQEVDRVGLEAEAILEGAQEGVAQLAAARALHERFLQQVMHPLEPVAGPERDAELLEPPRGEPPTARQPDFVRGQIVHDLPRPRLIVRITLEVEPVLPAQPAIGRRVDVVHRPIQRRQPAGDERLAQAARRGRQIMHDAKAAEALPQDAPLALRPQQLAADELGVSHDVVGAEMRHVVGLRLR